MKYTILALLIVAKATYSIECGATTYAAASPNDAATLMMKYCDVCDTAAAPPSPRAPTRLRVLAAPTGADLCLTPTPGYFVNTADGVLTACSPNCADCTDGSTCVTCDGGYFLETTGSTCYQDPSCADYTAKSGAATTDAVCAVCAPGYYEATAGDATTCTMCETGCGACTAAAAAGCTTAAPGWRLDAGALTQCTDTNCAACDSDVAVCDSCMSGYVLFTPPTEIASTVGQACVNTASLATTVTSIITAAFKQIASVLALASLVAFFRF